MSILDRIKNILVIRNAYQPEIRTLGWMLTCVMTVACAGALHGMPLNKQGSRRSQLIEANIIAVHAYQVILARNSNTGSITCYPRTSPDTDTLQALVKHQKSLLAEPVTEVEKWADSKPSSFDAAKDLQPLLDSKLPLADDLPVNVFTRYFHAEVPTQPRDHIRSVANLYQTVLEVERDGDLLQDLYRFYIGLHLPVYVGQLGLPGKDADLLVASQKLAAKSCASPFGLSVPEWQIAGRKIWNWGEKNQHIRDADTLAKEMLAEPQIAKLIPAMKAMKAERIAVIGDSYTMDAHWASPSAFPPIVTAMFARVNPAVQFHQWMHGGLNYARAYPYYYKDVLAWKPDVVLLVVETHSPADADAMKTMITGFRAAGIRVLQFDDVEWAGVAENHPSIQEVVVSAKEEGAEIIPSRAALDTAPTRASFPAMDGIHKTEPYHRVMAYLWLKAVLGTSTR